MIGLTVTGYWEGQALPDTRMQVCLITSVIHEVVSLCLFFKIVVVLIRI